MDEPMYRVLEPLERLDGTGVHPVNAILTLADLRPTSIGILMERGIIMPWLDPDWIAALPDHE